MLKTGSPPGRLGILLGAAGPRPGASVVMATATAAGAWTASVAMAAPHVALYESHFLTPWQGSMPKVPFVDVPMCWENIGVRTDRQVRRKYCRQTYINESTSVCRCRGRASFFMREGCVSGCVCVCVCVRMLAFTCVSGCALCAVVCVRFVLGRGAGVVVLWQLPPCYLHCHTLP